MGDKKTRFGGPRTWGSVLALACMAPQPVFAQSRVASPDLGLLVVYGAAAQSREGDVDHREQIFFSVPADFQDRLYIRVFDPETSGDQDFIYGSPADSETRFRIFGGTGALSGIPYPDMVENGARPVRAPDITASGKQLREKTYDSAPKTDGRWVTLGSVRSKQGEIIDGRSYFRMDVEGLKGNDGNGYSIGLSTARDRNHPPEDFEIFSYQPTIRWPGEGPATQVWFSHEGGPVTVQNFDGANGSLSLGEMYKDIPLRISGQDFWASDTLTPQGNNLALSLSGGFERPNDVSLMVFDKDGAAIALTMPPRIAPVPARPTAIASIAPLSDCASVAFDGSSSLGSPVLTYEWDFGDGTTSDAPAGVHRYTTAGRYVAQLGVIESGERPARGDRTTVDVHVRAAPMAQAGSAIGVAPGETVDFDARGSLASDTPITKYIWTFGDGAKADGARVSHVYPKAGEYTATLRVEDASGHPCFYAMDTRQVFVNHAPFAEAGTDQSGPVGQTFNFSAQDSYDVDGQILDYTWDMGDGAVLAGRDVSHRFESPGRHVVRLTVTDDSGVRNQSSNDAMIVDVNAPPQPNFVAAPRALATGEAFQLDGSLSTDPDGTILYHFWDFGDGNIGEGPVATYAWNTPGRYDVTLTVVDNSDTSSGSQSVRQQVIVNAAPTAHAGEDQFVTASDLWFDAGASTDQDGRIIQYEWDFGDGTTGTGAKVRHAYARPGTYDIALTVQDDSGAPRNRDRDVAQVTVNARPIADAGAPQTVAPGQMFVVDAGASLDPDGAIKDYAWIFPDGTTKHGERVEHHFDTAGLHRVRLSVTDDFPTEAGQDETEILITVNAAPVSVAGTDIVVAPGTMVSFDGSDSFDPDGGALSYRWEFDDLALPLNAAKVERAYVSPGVWGAQLIVTDDSGVANATAVNSRTIRVNHPPIANAGPEILTDTLKVELDASASSDADGDTLLYRWDLGDGSPVRFGQKITHFYTNAGHYPVTLQIDDGSGVENATAIDATSVSINARPVAQAGRNRDVCSGEPILFDASASRDADADLLRYRWNFGDGTNADIVNPTKTYEQPGTYAVTLEVQDETGGVHGTDVDRIAAIVREGPIADAGQDRTVCTNQQIRMDGSGSTDADGAVNAFAWSFGDGREASGEQPVHIFKRPGVHTVTLTITGEAHGTCSPLDTDTAIYTVVASPAQMIAAPLRAATGKPILFTALLKDAGDATPISHSWNFSDGVTGSTAEVIRSFDTPGVYDVTLQTSLEGGNAGCSTLDTVHRIVVNSAPIAALDAPASIASGEALVLDASGSTDTDGAITQFLWDFGDGHTSQGVLGAHRYETPGDYVITLSVTDDAGVANSTTVAETAITVNPRPLAGLTNPGPLCVQSPREWVANVGPDMQATWDFSDGTAAQGNTVSHAFSASGQYPVTLTLDDGKGLANSVSTEVIVAQVNAPPTALAGADRIVCPGDTVALDASSSTDLDGTITEWLWEFSDGVEMRGKRIERAFDQPGQITARLTVTDDSGATCNTAFDEASILVNAPPVVSAGTDRSTLISGAHDFVRFDASEARDPDGHGVFINWDFGDGSNAPGAVARHKYSAQGDFSVTVTATDSTGLACGVSMDTITVKARERDESG
ncbi:PKD domain-containing protein [Shimia litoralis]|uniref:PKD domain-containing protein n=1 Tax=Shimia litoralis TaxID=420403 RepID=A0A4U7N0Q0_9RHOB|nr:PKD domain-containing protein [Shimia litoralis]TKZ19199.1 PKD domain-containing protein [Shimia litoralis]